jgi:Lar family restriction alleviation protein
MPDTTPNLLPCPFCGSTGVGIDSSVGGAFVSCDSCEARGPFVEYRDDQYGRLQDKAVQDAKARAIATWNQRNTTFKPLP